MDLALHFRALASCEAISVALRTSTLRAALGVTLYVAAAAGPAGAAAALRTVEGALDAAEAAAATPPEQGSGAPREQGAEEEDDSGGNGGEGSSSDEQLDSYLQTAPGMTFLKPNITLVVVEALPRGWVRLCMPFLCVTCVCWEGGAEPEASPLPPMCVCMRGIKAWELVPDHLAPVCSCVDMNTAASLGCRELQIQLTILPYSRPSPLF